jgi:hypothetical protein
VPFGQGLGIEVQGGSAGGGEVDRRRAQVDVTIDSVDTAQVGRGAVWSAAGRTRAHAGRRPELPAGSAGIGGVAASGPPRRENRGSVEVISEDRNRESGETLDDVETREIAGAAKVTVFSGGVGAS